MTCPTCGMPNNIPCQCHLKYVYYEDINNITRHSAYKYTSLESFLEMCKNNYVDMNKMFNARWGE